MEPTEHNCHVHRAQHAIFFTKLIKMDAYLSKFST